jgi:hypothetical protein
VTSDFVAMMSNGASGDINNIPFLVNRPPREPFEQIRIVAQKAADAAWFARGKIASTERMPARHARARIDAPLCVVLQPNRLPRPKPCSP